MQLLIDLEFMPFLSEGYLSTDKLFLQFVHNIIVSFPVWAGIKINLSPKNWFCMYITGIQFRK